MRYVYERLEIFVSQNILKINTLVREIEFLN